MSVPRLHCSTVLLSAALAAQAPPSLPPQFESGLPASTYACLHFGGLAACSTATAELPLAEVVGAFVERLAPHVREQHLDRALERPADRARRMLEHLGIAAEDLRALLGRPATLGLGRLSIEGMGPSVAIVIDEGNRRNEIERCFSAFERLAVELGGAEPATSVDVHGIAMRRMVTPVGVPVFWGSIGGRFVASNSRGYVGELVEVARGGARSLAAATHLPRDGAALAPALAAMMVNTASIADAIAPHLPYEATDWADALGIGRLESIEASMSVSARGGSDVLHVALHGRKDGLLKALVARPVDLGFASMCTDDTVAFVAGSLDFPAATAAFDRFVALLPQAARRELRRSLANELRSPELHAAFAAFGPRFAMALALGKTGVPVPQAMLRVEVRDRQAAASLMQRLERGVAQAASVEWRSRAVGDREVRFCSIEVQDGHLQLSPCYALLDDGLVVASDVAALVRALRPERDPANLAAQDDFVAMAKAATGSSGVVYLRSFRAVERGWRTVESWVFPLVDRHADQLGFDSGALPDTETMANALGSTTITWRVDDDGITFRHDGTFALGAMVAAMGAVGDELLRRASTRTY